jgi:aminoglycoside phosphotransferase (APT) family kinase protein
MAALGQPEMDLGWFLYFDNQFTSPLGVPRPAGFPSHEETIERYSAAMGRPMQDLFFYEIFSGFRFAVVMLRLSDLLLESKILPAEADMRSNNLATQYLATLLDLEPPT